MKLYTDEVIVKKISDVLNETIVKGNNDIIETSVSINSVIQKSALLNIKSLNCDQTRKQFANLKPTIVKVDCGCLALFASDERLTYIMLNYHEASDFNAPEFGQIFLVFSRVFDIMELVEKFKLCRLFEMLKLCIVEIYYTLVNYERIYLVIDMYSELMRKRDRFMPYHMTNVSKWSMAIGEKFSLSKSDLYKLNVSALLHDIGKLQIDESIINKWGKLNDIEYAEMMKHSEKSYKLARSIFNEFYAFKDIPNIIRCHHERYDGAGYPSGLSKGNIPFLSRILTVADSIDAMLSKRVYKHAMPIEEVMDELVRCKGTQFDPLVVTAAFSVLESEKDNVNLIYHTDAFFPNVVMKIESNGYNGPVFSTGNLISHGDHHRFLPYDYIQHNDYTKMNIAHNVEISLCFNDIYHQYNGVATEITEDKVILSILSEIPQDKYFSLTWMVKCSIISGNTVFMAETSRIGASSLTIEVDQEICNMFVHGDSFELSMAMTVNDEELDIKEFVHISDIVPSSNGYLFICNYSSLTIRNRDFIMRMLFRKQADSRKLNINHLREAQS